jgi:hypothetical protein
MTRTTRIVCSAVAGVCSLFAVNTSSFALTFEINTVYRLNDNAAWMRLNSFGSGQEAHPGLVPPLLH